MAAVSNRKAKRELGRSLTTWAQQCTGGHAKEGHSYCKGVRAQGELYDMAYDGCAAERRLPDDAVKLKGKFWHDLWSRDASRTNELIVEMRHARIEQLRTQDKADWCGDDVQKGIWGCVQMPVQLWTTGQAGN